MREAEETDLSAVQVRDAGRALAPNRAILRIVDIIIVLDIHMCGLPNLAQRDVAPPQTKRGIGGKSSECWRRGMYETAPIVEARGKRKTLHQMTSWTAGIFA